MMEAVIIYDNGLHHERFKGFSVATNCLTPESMSRKSHTITYFFEFFWIRGFPNFLGYLFCGTPVNIIIMIGWKLSFMPIVLYWKCDWLFIHESLTRRNQHVSRHYYSSLNISQVDPVTVIAKWLKLFVSKISELYLFFTQRAIQLFITRWDTSCKAKNTVLMKSMRAK